jgi:hypothetical protein
MPSLDKTFRFGKMKIQLSGMGDLFRKLDRLGEDVNEAGFEVFDAATKRVFGKSQQTIPVLTGAGKQSGRRSKPRISRRTGVITASVSYGGAPLTRLAPNEPSIYLLAVHEDPNHRGYKFLERPMTAEKANVLRDLERRVATRIKRLQNAAGVGRRISRRGRR